MFLVSCLVGAFLELSASLVMDPIMLYLHVGIRVNQLSYTWNAFQPLSERLIQIQNNTHKQWQKEFLCIYFFLLWMALILYKIFTLIEYCPFWGCTDPIIRIHYIANIQRNERFSVKFMVKSLVENYFFITKLLAKTHETSYLTF